MHELPQGLTNSLRSWRGSVYSNAPRSVRQEPSDLEKGEDYGEKDFEQALSPSHDSSIILHPTASRQGLNQAHEQQQQSNQHVLHHRPSKDRLPQLNTPNKAQQQQQQQQQLPNDEKALAKRQDTNPPQTAMTASTGLKSVFDAPKVDDPSGAADRLDDDLTPLAPADFYELMRMKEPISKQQNPKELAIRHGLYFRIRHAFVYIQRKYRIFDVLTYALLLLQLLLSAVFIVLGSLSSVDSHVAIAVLGAISTVIAGALALMKGQGLPNRLRQTRDGLRNVLFEAEELYWDVGAEKPVLYKDVKKVRTDFLRVMEENRRNHPDTRNAISVGMAHGTQPGSKGKAATVAQGSMPVVK